MTNVTGIERLPWKMRSQSSGQLAQLEGLAVASR